MSVPNEHRDTIAIPKESNINPTGRSRRTYHKNKIPTTTGRIVLKLIFRRNATKAKYFKLQISGAHAF